MTTTPERLNAALARQLVEHPHFQVSGKTEGYRNKICYSLSSFSSTESSCCCDDPFSSSSSLSATTSTTARRSAAAAASLQVSNQARPLLNDICITVDDLAHEYVGRKRAAGGDDDANNTKDKRKNESSPCLSSSPSTLWCNFFVEVTAKLTRLGEVMVKINVTSLKAAEFVSSGDGSTFARRLAQSHPCVKCVVLQVAPEGKMKGTKYDSCDGGGGDDMTTTSCSDDVTTTSTSSSSSCVAGQYIPLLDGRTTLQELTPNGVPLQLSIDSFTEVNPEMEVEMHRAALSFLRAPAAASTSPKNVNGEPQQRQRAAIIMGRDCNVVYLSMRHVYQHRALLVTNCPRARADAVDMGLPNFLNVDKPDISEKVFRKAFPEANKKFSFPPSTSDNCDDNGSSSSNVIDWDLLVTAGRHGIHPSAREAIVDNAILIKNFLYTSCNLESLTRDLHVFRRAFFVSNCRTFDFFPGTSYKMTMVHFRPLRTTVTATTSSSVDAGHTRLLLLSRELLVLPVAAPGCGKSSCSRELVRAFSEQHPHDQKKSKNGNKSNRAQQQQQQHNLRAFCHRAETLSCQVFERDAVFQKERQVPQRSLATAKSLVHSQLISFLASVPVVQVADGQHQFFFLKNKFDADDESHCNMIKILDSTNGSMEQRREYLRIFRNKKQQQQCAADDGTTTREGGESSLLLEEEMRPVAEIYFDPASSRQFLYDHPIGGGGVSFCAQYLPSQHYSTISSSSSAAATPSDQSKSVVDTLVARCLRREGHPAFPTEEEEARRKVCVILDALERPQNTQQQQQQQQPPAGAAVYTVSCGGDDPEGWKSTFDQFSWAVFLAFFADAVNVGLPIFLSSAGKRSVVGSSF